MRGTHERLPPLAWHGAAGPPSLTSHGFLNILKKLRMSDVILAELGACAPDLLAERLQDDKGMQLQDCATWGRHELSPPAARNP